jgi:double-stranded uracil-DNA glycosylase
MDRATIDTYERRAAEWVSKRTPHSLAQARAFGALMGDRGWRADLGCGPGWYAAAIGEPVVAIDAARAMLDIAPAHAPHARRVQGDLEALPLRRGALAGGWASASYVHLPAEQVPLALGELHRAVAVGGTVVISMIRAGDHGAARDLFGGRLFSAWDPDRLRDVFEGAGFAVEGVDDDGEWLRVHATRLRTLADSVGPGMRLLLVGLNPSVYAADAGVGFARPGNRFWPAALDSGLLTRDRDAQHALVHHGVGMTDFVKRATRRAGELAPEEYRHGSARVERLVAWLQPHAVCVVGLTGWRVTRDRTAAPGWQPAPFGGRPVYVMPNPSGLNARVPLAVLAGHLRAAAAGPYPAGA